MHEWCLSCHSLHSLENGVQPPVTHGISSLLRGFCYLLAYSYFPGMGLWYFAIRYLSFLLRDDTSALAHRIYLMSCYWMDFFHVETFGSVLRWLPTAQSCFQTLVRAYSLRPNLDFLHFDGCPKTAFEVCRKEWRSRGDTEPSWIRRSSHGERKFLEDHSIIKVWKSKEKKEEMEHFRGCGRVRDSVSITALQALRRTLEQYTEKALRWLIKAAQEVFKYRK